MGTDRQFSQIRQHVTKYEIAIILTYVTDKVIPRIRFFTKTFHEQWQKGYTFEHEKR